VAALAAACRLAPSPSSARAAAIGIGLLVAAVAGGCHSIGYYAQAVSGQLDILARARPIEEWLADPSVPSARKARLALAVELRDFAVRELGLPDNGSYRRFADLERPYALWNVFATEEFSLALKSWCFPIAGCVSYRGYFSRAQAEAFAAALSAEGHETYVAGVTAYSTLGWFDDPLLNTMLDKPEVELAALLFHELAHQRLYVRGDSAFNESFAVAVELEGVRRWLATRGEAARYAGYLESRRRRDEWQRLLLDYRARLDNLYRSALDEEAKREAKRALYGALARDYGELKTRWGGYDGFDAWMQEINNAKLAAVGLYHRFVPAFQVLLERHQGDLAAFYAACERLARLPGQQRHAALAALAEE
jgi:predicted aminopeptidase